MASEGLLSLHHSAPRFDPQDDQALRPLWTWLTQCQLSELHLDELQKRVAAALEISVDRRLVAWRAAIEDLTDFEAETHPTHPMISSWGPALTLGAPEVHLRGQWRDAAEATETLQRLHPWRKGPIRLGDILIDTEWRSDWKWERVAPHLELSGARVLDIGCGNGYHCWRALGDGAEMALGVDPTRLFHYQQRAIQVIFERAMPEECCRLPIHHLPLTLEALDDIPLPYFHVVLSMGVLYHRRDPQAHLKSLQRHFAPQGGQLLLETLITPDDQPLYPSGRYAQMRNVWCLPDRVTLINWLSEAGYSKIEIIDENQTTLDEQRQTEWMRFYSLKQALNPEDLSRTIEGHPAPLRAALTARYQPR